MTKAEQRELDALFEKKSKTEEERARYRELLQKLIEEELYWGDSES